jgi:hypothetical protein
VLAAGALCPGLPQSTPSRHAGSPGLAPVTDRANPRSSKDSFTIAYPLVLCADQMKCS